MKPIQQEAFFLQEMVFIALYHIFFPEESIKTARKKEGRCGFLAEALLNIRIYAAGWAKILAARRSIKRRLARLETMPTKMAAATVPSRTPSS